MIEGGTMATVLQQKIDEEFYAHFINHPWNKIKWPHVPVSPVQLPPHAPSHNKWEPPHADIKRRTNK